MVSDLNLQCLHLTCIWNARLYWVNSNFGEHYIGYVYSDTLTSKRVVFFFIGDVVIYTRGI